MLSHSYSKCYNSFELMTVIHTVYKLLQIVLFTSLQSISFIVIAFLMLNSKLIRIILMSVYKQKTAKG